MSDRETDHLAPHLSRKAEADHCTGNTIENVGDLKPFVLELCFHIFSIKQPQTNLVSLNRRAACRFVCYRA